MHEQQIDSQRATSPHHPNRVPEEVVGAFVEDEMAHDAPEGRGPRRRALIRSEWTLAVVGIVCLTVIVGVFIAVGTALGVIVTAGLVLLFALAAAPVWGAGLLQHEEREHARAKVRDELKRGHV